MALERNIAMGGGLFFISLNMKRSLFMLFIFASALVIAAGTKAGVIEKSSASCSVITKHVDHFSIDMVTPQPIVLVDMQTYSQPFYNEQLADVIRQVSIMNKGSPAEAMTSFRIYKNLSVTGF